MGLHKVYFICRGTTWHHISGKRTATLRYNLFQILNIFKLEVLSQEKWGCNSFFYYFIRAIQITFSPPNVISSFKA